MGQGRRIPLGGALLHRGTKEMCPKTNLDTTLLGMRMQLHMECATAWGAGHTCATTLGQGNKLYQERNLDTAVVRMQMQLRARQTTVRKNASRCNCVPDADAIAHGMSNRVGAGPPPTAWTCATAWGQGQQLWQKRAVDKTVLRMQMQLRMGCATA